MAIFTRRKRRSKSWLSYSWLYLMRRVPFSAWPIFRLVFALFHWVIPVLWGGRYKIGISNDPDLRRRRIDNDLPGGIIVVFAVPVLRVTEKESYLHRAYKRDRYKPRRAGKSAGRSEHFNLNLFQVIEIKALMVLFFLKSNIVGLMALTFISYIVYNYYLQQAQI